MPAGAVIRALRSHPRLFGALALGLATAPLWPEGVGGASRVILSFDLGGVVFLALTWIMMARATHEGMRSRARLQDEGRRAVLAITVGASIFAMAAVAVELKGVHDLPSDQTALHIGLAGASIVCAWLVTHTMFALHYAHGYYGDREDDAANHRGGLDFPGQPRPDYWDFLYFAFVIGMACQTADVAIKDRAMRRQALAQGVLAFFFNTVILALSINIAAGLL